MHLLQAFCKAHSKETSQKASDHFIEAVYLPSVNAYFTLSLLLEISTAAME